MPPAPDPVRGLRVETETAEVCPNTDGRVTSFMRQAAREVVSLLLVADMPVPDPDPLVGGQLVKPHWPARMEFLRAYSHFRPEAKLPAVREAGARVDVNSSGIDSVDKALCVDAVVGQNTVRMVGAVFVNMVDRFVQA